MPFLTWAKSLTKFNLDMQDYKRVLVINCVGKMKIEQFNFFQLAFKC